MLLNCLPLSPLTRLCRSGLLLMVLGTLPLHGLSAIAQDTTPELHPEPLPTESHAVPEATATLDNLGTAENAAELSPRLRPAANSGDLVGDFFSVSVSACSLDPELLTLDTPEALAERGFTSNHFASQQRSTQPSLWWARTRFGQANLIQDWLINAEAKQMNLIVDRTQWSTLNYVGKYRVVHQFGTIARRQGYELRIFNTQPK